MAIQLNRAEMIKMLHELDNELNSDLIIEICGSSCAILNHGLNRSSGDIDIMRSSINLTDSELHKAIHTVAIHHGSDDLWLNDHSKEFLKKILDDFKPSSSPISGEQFKHLKPRVISKADFVITKLAYYDYIRQHDILDLKSLSLNNDDVKLIYKKLDDLSKNHPYDSLMIEGNFKSIRSDLVKDDNSYSYSNGKEIADYALKRYGIKASLNKIDEWQDSLDNLSKKSGSIIANIDLNAAKLIKENNQDIVEFDKNYRNLRNKDMDYGYDL